jgi:hypothetical protein
MKEIKGNKTDNSFIISEFLKEEIKTALENKTSYLKELQIEVLKNV